MLASKGRAPGLLVEDEDAAAFLRDSRFRFSSVVVASPLGKRNSTVSGPQITATSPRRHPTRLVRSGASKRYVSETVRAGIARLPGFSLVTDTAGMTTHEVHAKAKMRAHEDIHVLRNAWSPGQSGGFYLAQQQSAAPR